MQKLFTTREVAERLGVSEWQVRRLFEDDTLSEPQKFGGKRMIPQSRIALIRQAMESRGWLDAVTANQEAH